MTAEPALPADLPAGATKGGGLRDVLAAVIEGLAPGAPLPSERRLAERYGVARMTVRGELERLAAAGAVERAQGRGTFVAEPRVAQAGRMTSFTEDMRARGHRPGSTVLCREVVAADAAVAGRLGVDAGADVLRVERLRTADERPMALEEALLPAGRFARLERADLATGSLFELLEQEGVALQAARQRVVSVVLAGAEATLLGVADGSPGLRFDTIVTDAAGGPVFCATSLYRGDRYAIELYQRRG